MQAPWQTYYNEIRMLFGQDPEITTSYDEDANVVKLLVDNAEKADAIAKILPFERDFGGVTVQTQVIPPNGDPIGWEAVEYAFKDNPVFSQVVKVDDPRAPFSMAWCMFKKEVAQFWNDNLGDPHGNTSMLYEDIAKDVLDVPGVMFSTEDHV